jgi:hypothetical protein
VPWPSRDDISDWIARALAERDDAVRAEWNRMRIEPEKWSCSPYADDRGGFWAVAVDGERVLWFNDNEDGFNWSRYTARGRIDEYWCNQTEFAEILEEIAQRISASRRGSLREDGIPAAIAGPGTIEFRQTTYWDVRASVGSAYRIHFRDKAEFAFDRVDYPSIELEAQHPLLVQYEAPWRSLYVFGKPENPPEVAQAIERAIQAASASWRSLRDYECSIDSVAGLLRAGHGMLMHAPEPICNVASRILEPAGVQCSILGGAPARPGKRVAVLGRSYVVASGFAFERLGDTKDAP